ncbi:MAG TPA: hypothetical protein VGK73_21240 [Polyangiaceae bacterium]
MTDVRRRLVKALHTSATLPALREELVLVLCDLEEEQTPTLRSVALDITDADGRYAPPDTQPDSAPPTPVDSAVGQEFGP